MNAKKSKITQFVCATGNSMDVISRKEAERLFVKGEKVYIGTYNVKDGGALWNISVFEKDIYPESTAHGQFAALARYFHRTYGYGYKTRYAKDTLNLVEGGD